MGMAIKAVFCRRFAFLLALSCMLAPLSLSAQNVMLPPPDFPERLPIPFAPVTASGPLSGLERAAQPIQIANLPLGLVTFPNGKAINLTVGIGSSAFRQNGDPPGRIWLLTDRGPNIDCADAKRLIGADYTAQCANDKRGRIYPLIGFAPSIYGVDIGADQNARITDFIPLKSRSGKPISGRPNLDPQGGEQAYGIDGKALPPDPSGIDPEAFIRLRDGSFWIGEEFGPSLLHVAPDGTILKRLVPMGSEGDFKDADYEILPVLPPLMRKRYHNHGIEALAISPDERFLFVLMQSPLAHPDLETTRASRHARIWKINRETGTLDSQYFYLLEENAAAKLEPDTKANPEMKPSIPHISEMTAIGEDRLLVLEQIDRMSRIFEIKLDDANRIPPPFEDETGLPSFEAQSLIELALRGLFPAEKRLIVDKDVLGGLPAKLEGMALLSPKELIVINDNDFGIDGARTQMFRIPLPNPILP
jgi:Esterase-like activity of phytase